MRTTARLISFAGLGLTLLPCLLLFRGIISWETHTQLMFAGMLCWFVFAPLYRLCLPT